MNDKQRASSKAKLIRDALRAAAELHARPMAQALYATLIAEAWWDRRNEAWATHTSQDRLAQRLNVSDRTVRRAITELVELQLLYVRHIGPQRPAKYYMPRSFPAPDLLPAPVQSDTSVRTDRTLVSTHTGHQCPGRTPTSGRQCPRPVPVHHVDERYERDRLEAQRRATEHPDPLKAARATTTTHLDSDVADDSDAS